MDKLTNHQNILLKVLNNHVALPSHHFPNIQDILVVNEAKNHFILLSNGWKNDSYIHQIVFHLELKSTGEIWILENRTDVLIDKELISNGINPRYIFNYMNEQNSEKYEQAKAA